MNAQAKISRRQFLVGCAGIVGASTLVCSGLGGLAIQAPGFDYVDTRTEGANAMKKILVTYATRAGSTVEVAAKIGDALSANGATVDVRPIKNVRDVNGYAAVVIGSAIRMGNWLPEAVEFVKKNQAQLNKAPTAFFTVHLLNAADDAESRAKREAYTEPVRKIVAPKAETFFAGKMEYAKLSLFESMMSKAMKAPEQDLRDWNKIRSWAESLALALNNPQAQVPHQ